MDWSNVDVPRLIKDVLAEIGDELIAKNTAYGNSALDPVRIFSRADAEEQINVRIDDKISRIMRGQQTERVPEDTERDLLGYLVLKRVLRTALRREDTSYTQMVVDATASGFRAVAYRGVEKQADPHHTT